MKNGTKKTLKLGTYTLVICAVAVAIVIFINFLAGVLPSSVTQIDTSDKNLYDLSETSVNICQNLDRDVVLYFVTYEGSEDTNIQILLNRYADLSSHLKVETVDPRSNPGFLSEYDPENSLSLNSIVAVSADNYRAVDYYDIYSYSEDLQEQIYTYYYTYGSYPDSVSPDTFSGETAITGAIDYVTSDNLPTLYYLSGNEEESLSDDIQELIEKENFTLSELNLLSEGSVPEDAAAILIYVPTTDLTTIEVEALESYAADGGKFLLCSYWSTLSEEKFPNFCSFLAQYGVKPVDGLVCETGSNFSYANYWVLPTFNTSCALADRVDGSSNRLLTYCQYIEKTGTEGVTVTDILTTSSSAYARMNLDSQNPDLAKQEGDPEGTLSLGVQCTKDEDGSVLYWYASGDVAVAANGYVPSGNSELFLETLISMCGKQNSVTAGEARSLSVEPLTVAEADANLWGILLIGVLPLILIVASVVIFVRRRRR